MTLGTRITELLEKKNMKKADLAKMTGLSKSMIGNYVNGTSEPNTSSLISIAKCLDVSLDYLAFGHEEYIDMVKDELLRVFDELTEENKLKAIGEISKIRAMQNFEEKIK